MKNILFIDDDERILKTSKFYFKNQYTVLLAGNTREAFEILTKTPVDVIVSDYGMMGGNGVEFKTTLNGSIYKDIPFIVVSGEINKESSIKFANLKVDKIIEKPLDLSLLDVVLKDIIKQSNIKKDEKKMSFIGKNTGQIIHDINNSLGIIMISADIGESIVEPQDKVQTLFSKSKNACTKISEIIRKYKTLANNEGIALKDYSIHFLENYLEKELKDYAIGNLIDVQLSRCNSSKSLSLDLTLITQGILNLVANSRDAINESQRIGVITVELQIDSDYLLIKIKDNGNGIPVTIKENLFQEKNSSKGNKGTGMGLTYCKEIFNLHFGKIWLSQSDSSGSEFSIKLPLIEKE